MRERNLCNKHGILYPLGGNCPKCLEEKNNKMSRIDRIKWTDDQLGIKGRGGMMDLMDMMAQSSFRLTIPELDLIGADATDEDLDIISGEPKTFAERRLLIKTLNKYVYQDDQAILAGG
jgi:hypothetical protein